MSARFLPKALASTIAAVLALWNSACVTRPAPWIEPLAPAARAALIEEGREIAANQCGACHAVGRNDLSSRADAPPLRNVLDRYDSAALAGNLMIGVRVGHADMPLFHMGPRGADALVEYLYSIRSPDERVEE
jgi:mono/diheme cytochrome c family protein